MSPARTLKHSRMSGEDSAARERARGALMKLYEAMRLGRVRVVDPPNPTGYFRPRMEVFNDPDSPNIIATFELPGVKISDLTISVRQGMLLLQGTRHARYPLNRTHPSLRGNPQAETGDMDVDSSQTSQASPEDAQLFPRQELRYGPFRRALHLPAGVDTSCITASLSDGLLTVSWPRSPAAATKQTQPSPVPEHSSVQRPTSSVRADPRGATGYYSHESK
ncbi:HSP20-like chaperone [Mycena vulgaris]|nr:HSP20-like chaperone [Mycena vulgaris]